MRIRRPRSPSVEAGVFGVASFVQAREVRRVKEEGRRGYMYTLQVQRL